ncbi:MAG: SH3 domain-containing protein [Thermomicrobiales bacterium]
MSHVARMKAELWVCDQNNRRLRDISQHLVQGVVEMNQDAEVQLSFTASIDAGVELLEWREFLAPILTLTYATGRIVTGQVGLYVVVPPPKRHRWRSSRVEIDGRDLTYLLARDAFETTFIVDENDDPLYKARQVIESSGIAPDRIRFTPRSPRAGKADIPTTFLSARDWPPGTAKLDIVNDILTELDYYTLYMDQTGRLVSKPTIDAETATADVAWFTGDGSEVIGEIAEDPSLATFGNVVIVVGDNPTVETKIPNPSAPAPPTIGIGRTVQVTADIGLNLRTAAGLGNPVITVQPLGTVAKIIGGPTTTTGYTWWRIESQIKGIGTRTGWSAQDWLEVQAGDPDPVTDPPPPPPITAIRINDDASSSVSTVTLGRRIVRETENLPTIETQAQADAIADRLIQESLSYYRRLTLGTLPDPRRTLHEIYALTLRNRRGDVIADGNWYCRGWTLGFTPDDGEMKHICHRIEPYKRKEVYG